MFEFTMLGVVVALVGSVYLFTVGWWLTPERITAEEDLPADFDLTEYLTEVSDSEGLDLLPEVEVADAELETPEHSQGLVEVVVAPQSSLVGETLASIRFLERYDRRCWRCAAAPN
jgi:di/tricarboxylate transporter